MTEPTPMEKRVAEVADALLGTADPLYDHFTDDEQNDISFCKALDMHVAQCECCNWWVLAGDVNDEYQCAECSEEE